MLINNVLDQLDSLYSVPTYIFDTDILDAHVARFRQQLDGRASLCFAIKANAFLTQYMAALTDRVEVCSMGEFRICKALGIPAEKVLISGVLKKKADIIEIMDHYGDTCRYTAESLQQLDLLNEWALAHGVTLKVYPRLSGRNQFGMDEETIQDILANLEKYPGIELAGLHYFTGTQKRNVGVITKELDYMDEFISRMENELGITIPELEYGPGLAVSYFTKKDDTRYEDMPVIAEKIASMNWQGKVTLEMGRALAADCGYYMTKVLDLKKNDDIHYCIVDGGIHQINYDGQIRGMYLPHVATARAGVGVLSETATSSSPTESYMVCGSLCTVNDVLVKELPSAPLELGDYLIFQKTGAYSAMEGMALFLSHELPEVLLYSQENGFKVLRETSETFKFNHATY
ncbi:MAG: alanine racemase [Lachnospiraceae bacterium]|nr:alanine racemase [Candidatus Equihabitans merdae]